MAEQSFDPAGPSPAGAPIESHVGPRRRAPRRRLAATLVAIALVVTVAGCSAKKTVPPRPPLPAVVFVEACDPQAAIGMTEAGVAQLRTRDEAWRQHVEILEAIIREDD